MFADLRPFHPHRPPTYLDGPTVRAAFHVRLHRPPAPHCAAAAAGSPPGRQLCFSGQHARLFLGRYRPAACCSSWASKSYTPIGGGGCAISPRCCWWPLARLPATAGQFCKRFTAVVTPSSAPPNTAAGKPLTACASTASSLAK